MPQPTRRDQPIRLPSRSDVRLLAILESAPDAVVSIRADGSVLRWNRSAEEIFGWSCGEALGRPLEELIIPERFREVHREGLARVAATGAPPLGGRRRVEWTAMRRDGSEFPVEVKIAPEPHEDGPAFIAFIADITDRRNAEAERRAADARFRALVEYASDAIFLFDAAGRCSYASPAVTRVFGYAPAEVLGRELTELVHPDDRPYVLQRFGATPARSRVPLVAEFRFRHRSGAWKHVEVLRANHLDDPELRAIVLDVRDVSARRQAQHQHDELRRRYELIFNSISDGVHGVDLDGNIVFENPAAVAMLGWRAGELIGRPAHATVHGAYADGSPRPESDCPTHRTLADGTPRESGDDVFWRKDGTFVRVACAVAPMLDRHGRIAGVVVTFRDISRQRHMEQQIEQVSRMASLGRVSASVAHEMNNLLMSIKPFIEVIRRRGAGDEKLCGPAEQILAAVRRGRRLTDGILRFTRPADPHLETIDLASWLPRVREEVRGLAEERTLEVQKPDALTVLADADQLSQVVMNLVANARDATQPNGAITIGATRAENVPFLRAQLADPHGRAALFVRDDGSGIAPTARDRIFEPLFTTRGHGHGLGLAIVFQIVTRNGGQVLVDTEVGRGSTFYVVLPAG